MAKNTPKKITSIYLYIPNIIGYIRIFVNCYAFARCLNNKKLFVLLYFISFVLDGLDGWCARKFNQVSTLGAVLDMVVDRVSTNSLLVILSQYYSPGLFFLAFLGLDISSHWLQMYSTFLSGKASHKDVKDSNYWLLKTYYGNRTFMAYCCIAAEVFYLILYYIANNQPNSLIDVMINAVKHNSLVRFPLILSMIGWATKQIINVIQIKTSADACVLYDINRKQKP
ncbi:hypothetical protein Sjap_016668 [Stephania japonica]|uniref:CDP-diacylglycerol--inositol 3-phosphatidyltransferase n=1 Tax=Stephania japonica TaxID=461633 RepID=A0AAP0IN39_9MAGN